MTMTRIVSVLTAAAFLSSAWAGEPKEAVANAVKAIKEKGSYSWSSTVEVVGGQFPAMTTRGKTEKDGFTMMTAEGQNGEIQAVRKGEKGVLKTDDGWKTAEELRASAQGGGGGGRGFFGRMLSAPLPADDLEDLLKGIKEFKAGDGGVISGDLTPEAAKDRASFFRRRPGQQANPNFTPPEPKDAKGSAKFWLKDGALAKAEIKSSSKMEIQGEERQFDRTTTIEFSNVGSTKVEAPADAKKRLE